MRILVDVPGTELRAQELGKTPIDAYIARLDAALPGPRRKKADLLTEARDGLIDATEALEADGLSRSDAERQAIEDFGEIGEILPDYRAELGYAQGRRTAILMAATIMIQPIVWLDDTWLWNRDPAHDADPAQLWLNGFVENAGAVTLCLAVVVLVATGFGLRYPAVRGVVTKVTGVVGLLTSALIGSTAIVMALLGNPGLLGALTGIMWVSVFVLGPLSAVVFSAQRCLRLA